AALEACLALRDRLSVDELEITLVSPAERFDYRPLTVLAPFRGISRWSMSLASFAADQDVDLVRDALVAVGSHARVAVTGSGRALARSSPGRSASTGSGSSRTPSPSPRARARSSCATAAT